MAEYFCEIEDPRRTGFAHRHDLVEMLVIATCALFSEVEGFEDIARWARVPASTKPAAPPAASGASDTDRVTRADSPS